MGDQFCFTPIDPTLNQATLNFTSPDASGNQVPTGQVLLATGTVYLPNSIDDPKAPVEFSFDFTIQSGTDDFQNFTGGGQLKGTFLGSLGTAEDLTFNSLDSPNFAATPELDSLLLFGTGLSGIVAYAIRRRRAGKLPR